MPQLLSLARAARLADVSRAELQKRIRQGELATFEGKVAVSDLLRIYPDVDVDSDAVLERVESIKASARPKSKYGEGELPSAELLLSRFRSLSEVLVRNRSALNAAEMLLNELEGRLQRAAALDESGLRHEIVELDQWLRSSRKHLADQTDRKARLFAKDTFLRLLAAHVKIIPSGHDFFVEGNESILEASVRAGISLNYGCSSGNCGSCKARVVTGEVWKVRNHDYVLSEREKQMGYVLTCSNTAVTDLVLEADEALSVSDLPLQEIRASVSKVETLQEDMKLLHVKTPRTQTLRFMAGQRVQLSLEQGISAEYPIASCPCDGRNLQFFVRRRPGDAFSSQVFEELKSSQMVTVNGPTGKFVLIEDSTVPAVFVAFEDGFASVRSLIEHAISIDAIESFHLYWVASRDNGHFMDKLCRSWRDSLDNFSYFALNEETPERLLERIVGDHEDIGQQNYYLAGPQPELTRMAALLRERGVSPDRLRMESC